VSVQRDTQNIYKKICAEFCEDLSIAIDFRVASEKTFLVCSQELTMSTREFEWVGKMSAGLQNQNYSVAEIFQILAQANKIAVRFLKFARVGKKTILSQDPELTAATDEVEHWDLDMIFQRSLAR
jgi:hypothetical protein